MAVKYTIPYRSTDNKQWRVDIENTVYDTVLVQGTLQETLSPVFIDGNLQIVKNGVVLDTINSADSKSYTFQPGDSYRITAFCEQNAVGNPKIRLTITNNDVVIYDKQIVANDTAIMVKSGIAQLSGNYKINILTLDTLTPVNDVDIPEDTFIDAPIPVRGQQQNACVIAYTPDTTDDPYSTFISSQATLNLLNEGNIDLNELQQSQDRDFTVKVYKENVLYWIGFLITDNIQYPFKSTPTLITLTATDGLSLLADIPYVHANLPGTTYQVSRCPMNYFRQILFATANLGIVLPIRWVNTLICTAFEGQDVFVGAVQWSSFNEGFYSYQSGQEDTNAGTIKSCEDILKGMLQAMHCRIFQSDGRWNIRRINDVVTGRFSYKQIAGNLDIMVVQSATANINNLLGREGYTFVEEDALITSIAALKTCKITYNANIRDNILPNGSQDLFTNPSAPLTSPLFWGFYTSANNELITVGSIDGRAGVATQISHVKVTGGEDNGYYTLVSDGGELNKNGLPVDTTTLIAYINFGFMFSPETGFPVDGDNVIIWDTEPFKIRVVNNVGTSQFYLNKYGFWQTEATDIAIIVDGLSINDVAQIDFNKFQNIIMPLPLSQPVAGDTCDVQIIFIIQGSQQYVVDNIYINIDNGNDVYESTYVNTKNTKVDDRELTISSSFGGYMLSNFMTRWSESDVECNYRDAFVYTGTLTGLTANAMMRYRYKPSKVFNGTVNVQNANWSFDEIYLIDTFVDRKFLPLNATYNTEKNEVNLVAVECRSDNIELSEKFYNSNDNQLSN